MVIGRAADADLQARPEDLNASRRHAACELRDGTVVVRDLGSRSGTFVNGARITEQSVRSGDVIRCGGTEVHVEQEAHAPVERRCHLCGAPGSSPGQLAREATAPWVCLPCIGPRRTPKSEWPEAIRDEIGGWQIVRFIDRGGMSLVFEARHRTEGLHAALKLLRLRTEFDERRRQRFTREQQVVTALRHPAIVSAFEIGSDPIAGEVFIASELVTEGDAEAIASKTSRLDVVWTIGADLFSALAYAHAAEVIHRDVKPQNVLLFRDERQRLRAKLADFGLAKAIAGPSELETAADEVSGSAEFMPPEQALALADAGKPADLYSAGATLYYLLTEELPLAPDKDGRPVTGFMRLCIATVTHARIPIRDRRPEVPEEAARWIDLLVSRERERRAEIDAARVAAAFAELAGLGPSRQR